ncbi:pPIWI_RE_Z domain-containing protein [Nocardia cyriacigeorgica]|uniref:pPIWI-RE three-gene island domain-containing protein n=1 Tax=Nocardia cyriacigeorgica TaxID=135487 RepID=A0A4U8W2Y5_9NOCA|nr:hypothetical protein [Nocardia cyriacigeorgica]VFA96297.1 Uncharacterised protein [Nocardia cyriacigeorgica]
MRDASGWYGKLTPDLTATEALPADLSPKEFFSAELGLFFLSEHYPDEPIGGLWPLMSGYVACQPGLVPELRRLRLLMGEVGRSKYFPLCMDKYMKAPENIRGFRRTDATDRRVTDRSTFARRDLTHLEDRWEEYQRALASPVPYASNPVGEPAQPGHAYTFVRADGRDEFVEIVDIPDIELPPPPAMMPVLETRTRKTDVINRSEMRATAQWIDAKLAGIPDVPAGDYQRIWEERITDCVFKDGSDELTCKPSKIRLNGVTHEVGLMNSGKSVKAFLLTVNRVHAGWHVTVIVESVMKALELVARLRHLDIDAVPLVGVSSREQHAATYWQSTLDTSESTFPTHQDPAAAFASAICLLDPHRRRVDPHSVPLTPNDFPCRGQLRPHTGESGGALDCPLLSVCPFQLAEQRTSKAQVWVTTPQGLLRSKAMPAEKNMRWLEAVQHHSDLIIVDEADRVQKVFDDSFVQSEVLVAGDDGWADTTLIRWLRGVSRLDRIPMEHEKVQRFARLGRELLEAVDELYILLVTPENERLRKILHRNPFTGYSLLRRLTWALFGLPYGEVVEIAREQPAEDFFRDQLEDLALNPLDEPIGELRGVTESVLGRYRTEDDLEILDDWLIRHAPDGSREAVEHDLDHLRLLFQAALWSSRITTLFLQMSNLFPAVDELLGEPGRGASIWRDKPPADYDPLVPEALMGNLMALQWTRKGTGRTGDLRLMWVRGVGRWLIHHLHDLLEPEGIEGPNVLLTSATSWMKNSSLYHIDIRPSSILLSPDEDKQALAKSQMTYTPAMAHGVPVFVSGRTGTERDDALRTVTAHILRQRPGRPPLLERVRRTLDSDRQQVLFVTLSGDDAETAATHANLHTTFAACHVIPDDLEPGEYGLHKRQLPTFGARDEDVLVAAELAIQRGHNVLNRRAAAALGALFYLTRPHPPSSDLSFPVSLVNRDAMTRLLNPAHTADSVADTGAVLRHVERKLWHRLLGELVIFRWLRGEAHAAFVANAFVPMYQTIGRTIRGGTTTQVFLCDAAFAPRNAVRDNDIRDTVHTSLLVAIAQHLDKMLRPVAADADLDTRRDHVIDTTLYQLAHQLFTGIRWTDDRN